MQSQYLIAAWALAAWVLFRVIDSWLTKRRQRREAERLGCQEPPLRPNMLPFGLDWVKDALKADREHTFQDHIHESYKRMGLRTFKHHTLGTTGIHTNDPKNIQAILATQFKDFGLGDRRHGIFKPLLGKGIFSVDGKLWEHSRIMMRPQFNRDQVSDLDLEERHVQNLMRALPTDNSAWTSHTDLQVLFFRLTLDSACEFLFGESVDSQLLALPDYQHIGSKISDPAIDEKNFATAFDRSQAWLAKRAKLQDKYWVVDGPQARRDVAATHRFVEYFVRRALDHQSKGEKDIENFSGKRKYVFLEALAEQTKDPIELRDQLLNILLAGRDTTASLLGWTFWILGRHQDVFEKLRAAVLADFGPYDKDDTARLTYSSLKSCQYLQHVIAEVLRLYPVVAANWRQALKDTTLPRGGGTDGQSPIFVPKGATVEYSVHVMHRLTHLWGEDAEEFKPERWIGRKPGWEYLPFNGGPRICLGQQFALTEASYVLVRLLQRFDKIQNLDPDMRATYNFTLTSCPAKGVQVRLHEASA